MPKDVTFLHDIPVDVVVELGRARLTIRELAELGNDEILELDRPADQPLDLVVGGRVYARGEVVMVGERLAIRITSILGGQVDAGDEEEQDQAAVEPMKESA